MNYVSLDKAVSILKNDGLVVIPTETVYGLAGVGTSQIAVDKIFEYKSRPKDNPLICHFYSKSQILEYVDRLSEIEEVLIDNFMPGPLTLLLKSNSSRLHPASLGGELVGCRIPDNIDTLELIKKVDKPLSAPSANVSGKPSSTNPQMAYNYFSDFPGGIIDSAPSVVGIESTIIRVVDGTIEMLREGVIGEDEIRKILPNIYIKRPKNSKIVIPGSKYRHYSPDTSVQKIDIFSDKLLSHNCAVITTKQLYDLHPQLKNQKNILLISETNYLGDISRNLYQTLVAVDNMNCLTCYWFLPGLDLSTSSIGQALENRLSKVFVY